jgi:hypothetical protein
MNRSFLDIFWKHPSVYVTEDQLAHFLAGTPNSRYARLSRAVKKGDLARIKRGLYCLSERLVNQRSHPFELAQFIYGPSYVSLESALSYHGLIPEAVHIITSVTSRRNKEFMTPFGQFSYHHLPVDNFFLGVYYLKENKHQFFMASPWKAILDYIYCYKKEWLSLIPLQDNLRIELEDLPKISSGDLEQFKTFYHSKRIDHFVKNISKEFINEH